MKSLVAMIFVLLTASIAEAQCPEFREVRPNRYVVYDYSGQYTTYSVGNPKQLDVARCFYQGHPERDIYDSIYVTQTTRVLVHPSTYVIASRESGTIENRFDDSLRYGSDGRLRVISWESVGLMADPVYRQSGTIENRDFYDSIHEPAHWAAVYTNGKNADMFDLGHHFSYFLGTKSDISPNDEKPFGDIMGANPWKKIDGGKATLNTVGNPTELIKASDFTQYLLGLKNPEEIRGRFPIIDKAAYNPQTQFMEGEVARWVGIKDLIASQWGRRFPNASQSQRHMKGVDILVVNMHDQETLSVGPQTYVNRFIEFTDKKTDKWNEATWGKSTWNDARFVVPSLKVGNRRLKVGEPFTITLTGAAPDTNGVMWANDGTVSYPVPVRTDKDGSWQFKAPQGQQFPSVWSVIVYFGKDRETGGLTQTTSNLILLEIGQK